MDRQWMSSPARMVTSRVAAPPLLVSAVIAGLLWVAYGVFEVLQPWGEDTMYRDELGYEVVADALLYPLYSLPGSLALLLSALGLLGLIRTLGLRGDRAGRTGFVLTYTVAALAGLSFAGVVIPFDPLFTGPRVFGTVALGAATLLAGVAARRTGTDPSWAAALLALGLLGLFLLPLWPLVYAVEVIPEAGGAGIIALYGLGWALLGRRSLVGLQRRSRRPWARRGTSAPRLAR